MIRGVFWIIEDKVFPVPFVQGSYAAGMASSGDNYNHKLLWPLVRPHGSNVAYNFYPRGRVEVDNKGRPVIYLSCDIEERFVSGIASLFDIEGEYRVVYDGSRHYRSTGTDS